MTATRTARDIRQARTTTDPRFTVIDQVTALEATPEHSAITQSVYRCRGCSKTSHNGGSFGFHIRSCKALDFEDVEAELPAAELAYDGLTDLGRAFMASVGRRETDFFDDGIAEHSGNWSRSLTDQIAGNLGQTRLAIAGTMATLANTKPALWTVEDQGRAASGSDETVWWALTALGAQVARLAASDPTVKTARPAL